MSPHPNRFTVSSTVLMIVLFIIVLGSTAQSRLFAQNQPQYQPAQVVQPQQPQQPQQQQPPRFIEINPQDIVQIPIPTNQTRRNPPIQLVPVLADPVPNNMIAVPAVPNPPVPARNETPEEVLPWFCPDDPNLGKLLDQVDAELEQIDSEQIDDREIGARANQSNRKFEVRQKLLTYLYDTRQAELEKFRAKMPRSISRPNIPLFQFPELDGSSSCAAMGMIAICRSYNIPYTWAGRPGTDDPLLGLMMSRAYGSGGLFRSSNPVYFDSSALSGSDATFIKFRITPDSGKTNYRLNSLVRQSFGHFQGTHGSYQSLIGLPKDENGKEIIPEVPVRQSHPMAASVPPPIYTKECLFPPSEIILVARKPSPDELTAARAARVELDVRPIALDGFVFLVNRQNPVRGLTLQQIRQIYGHCEYPVSGDNTGQRMTYNLRVTNPLKWNQFGSQWDRPITVLERGFNSGSREIMDELVMNKQTIDHFVKTGSLTTSQIEKNRAHRYSPVSGGGMSAPYLALAGRDWGGAWDGKPTTDGIAYSLYNYEHFLACVPQVRVLEIDGVAPNYETIRSKKYPLVSEVYVVTRKGIPADSPTAILRDWFLCEDGQRVIRESGFVPINPQIAAE